MVKEGAYERACEIFDGTGVIVVSSGVTLLGCPIGDETFVCNQISTTITNWCDQLRLLAEFAKSQPQATYSSFVHGLFGRWTYFFRTCPISKSQLAPLENHLRCHLLSSLLGRDSVNDVERTWISLPSRYGGLGLICPFRCSRLQFSASLSTTSPLVSILLSNNINCSYYQVSLKMRDLKREAKAIRETQIKEVAATVRDSLPPEKIR